MRRRYGTQILFREAWFKVGTQAASDSKAGSNDLPQDVLKAWKAAADPRVFVFNPTDFAPYVEVRTCPYEGELIDWHGLTYVIAAVTFDDIGSDTHAIRAYAYRQVQ